MANMQRRGPALADTQGHEYGLLSPENSDRCGHRLLSVVPIASIRVEGGYADRCLLCGTTGPVRGDGEAARVVLLKQMGSEEE
jgi:hypothetical protein